LTTQGWKGSAKSKNLVLALRDHYVERARTPVVHSLDKKSKRKVPPKATDDMWALRYLTVMRAQPLLEALDSDFSAHVTISEVNAFTAGMPKNWTWVLI
jgi:hypothetical protein